MSGPSGDAATLQDAPSLHGSGGVPLVALGASAGGIQALSDFFDAMPPESGLAFLVVLHLDPTQNSHLASILAQHTAMEVREIADGLKVAANRVHVIAPNSDLSVDGDTLRLTEPDLPRGHRHPVDVLFRSIAEQRQARACAIILSGTGTNGTQGLKEVKAAGGLILVQDPANLRFDGMPRSAIGAGLADHVLAPADMPAALLAYFRHSYVAAPDSMAGAPTEGQAELEPVLAILRAHSGQEFRSYKPATLMRRIHRRMSLKGHNLLPDYLDRLRAEPAEIQALTRDLLISVTSFLRDTGAWAALEEAVIAPLVADRESGSPIRVWVPACATGEEAYSVAMLLIEQAEAANKQFDIRIFASDVLEANLNSARSGVYPGSSVETLATGRIRRFFEKLDGSYQVRSSLRELVVFAKQDLLREPPFSRMDLITCRNMLIYIQPEAQHRAVALFHFALREGGRLFLGSAETIGRADDLFETVSKKWRIYRRVGPTRHDIVSFPLLGGHPPPRGRPDPQGASEPSNRATEAARRALLDRYAPASVLIDAKGRVLYFHGDTADYLKQPDGEPTRDLLAMARDGLLARLRGALHAVLGADEEVRFSVEIRRAGAPHPVRVTVAPLAATQQVSGLVLVTFEPETTVTRPEPAAADGPDSQGVSALETELRSTRNELQGMVEQLESVNEELKAANEEATSMNEELQSTNEELETSKEELQSFNEELHSINNQLQHKIGELEQVSNDLANLLSGTEIATVFLDLDFRIKWFSPATKRLLELQSGDIGRPIGHFAPKFFDETLLSDAQSVLDRLAMLEAEIQSDDGRWYLRRVLPYRTRDNRIAGLVIAFVDIHERRLASDAINEARLYAEAIVTTSRQPLIVLDSELRVRSANRAVEAMFALPPEQISGKLIYEIGDRKLDAAVLRRLLEEVLPQDQHIDDVEIAFGARGVGQRTMMLNARRLQRNGHREPLILLAMEDITERKRAAAHQEMLVGELNHRVKNVLATVQAIMSQTLRRSGSLDDFAAAFEGRLHALAQAHNLLVQKEWVGAEIGDIVTSILAPYQTHDTSRIETEGARLGVRPQVGVALMMVLHELATNAVKYGALSVPGGKLTVRWHRHGEGPAERLHVKWSESGGPKVRPPSRQGFGTRLIERSTAHELGGAAHLDYLEEGLRCELIFPSPGKTEPSRGVA
ncbi:chemotaxis protein CheB [Lichenicoccus sp.]|uniref:chemotaxis protein CheB n=1 Tax=Lichenicoccus sp. TaxID=2781899 RepID=UPI003D1117EC